MSKLPSLYNISADIREVLDLLLDPRDDATSQDIPDEQLKQVFLNRLDALEGTLERKVGNCVKFHQMVDHQVEAHDREIARLKKQKEVMENGLARFRNYIQDMMDMVGRTEIQDDDGFGVKLVNNPPRLDITNLADLAKWDEENQRGFVTTEVDVVTKPDKKAIREAWKESGGRDGGEVPPGCKMVLTKRLKIT